MKLLGTFKSLSRFTPFMPTLFQSRVYALLKEIPAGKVTTYKILAQALGGKGYRAIGRACRENPFFPKVPCHRVVRHDGSLGGYQGKLKHPQKLYLLQAEGIPIAGWKIQNFKKYVFTFLENKISDRLLNFIK